MTKGIGAAVVAVQEIARWSGGWPIKEQHMTNPMTNTEPIPDDVEQWSLQFSNVPPAIMIWSAKAGHEPRNNSIALCQFDTVSDRNKQADQFRAIVAAHNQALLSLAGEVERKDAALKAMSDEELRLECLKLAHDWGKMRYREGYTGISLYDVTEKAEELRRYCVESDAPIKGRSNDNTE